MNLEQSLCSYFVVLVILILIFFRYGLTLGSAIILSLAISQILLLFLTPPHELDSEIESQSAYAIYSLIQTITIIVIYTYAIISLLSKK